MTIDEISKRSLRTLCTREMERRGDYVQVSIFAKTILDLLAELSTLKSQLDAVVGQETGWDDGFNRCKELAMHIVDEHPGFLDRIGYLDSVTAKPSHTPPLKAGQ